MDHKNCTWSSRHATLRSDPTIRLAESGLARVALIQSRIEMRLNPPRIGVRLSTSLVGQATSRADFPYHARSRAPACS